MESVLARYSNEHKELHQRVLFHLKNAAQLSGPNAQRYSQLAAELEKKPGQ